MAIIASGQITILDLNDAIVSGTAPANPVVGTLWIDTSVNPNVLKRWNGTQWTPQTLDLGNLDPQAQQDIDNNKITLANMADDTILTRQERSYVKDLVTKIIGTIITDNGTMPTLATLDSSGVGDVATARKSAVNAGIDISHVDYTDLGTKYTNLANYLNGLNPKPWDTTSSTNVTINPTTWRNTWLQFYTALGKLNQTVSDKLRQNAEGNLVDNPSITGAVGRWNKGTSPTIENIDFQGKTIPTMKVTTTGDVMVIHDDILVDPSKAYQVSLWFRSSTISTGTVYLGVYAYDSAGNNIGIDVVNDSTGAVTAANTNPYAWSGNNSSANTWVQRVFYIMPAGTNNNDMKQLGTNVTSNMRFLSNTRKLRIRWLNYYNSGTTKTVWVAHPRVTEVDPNAVLTSAKAKIDANTANSLLADISNDNKLTPVEKQDVKKEWDIIVGEKPIIEAQANTYGITTEKTNYVNAYNALNTYITPLLSNLNSTSDIVGTTFRANFKAYYDAKTALLKKISDTPKTIIDNIKIGGRNWLRGTGTEKSIIGENRSNQTFTPYYFVNNSSAPIMDKTITVSFDWRVEGVDSPSGTFYVQGSNPYPLIANKITLSSTNKSGRVVETRTITGSPFSGVNFRLDYVTAGAKLVISNMKIEIGNRSTDWTPAPEDVQEQIDGLGTRVNSAETSITQLANQIQLKANQTTVDALGNRISSAESSITLLSDEIDLKVDKNGVVSAINQTAEQIKIQASKIALDGYVEAKHIKSLNGLNVNDQFIVDSKGNVKFLGELEGATGTFQGDITANRLFINPFHTGEGLYNIFTIDWIIGTNNEKIEAFIGDTGYPELTWRALDGNNNEIEFAMGIRGLLSTNKISSPYYYGDTSHTNPILQDHLNGNVSLSALGADLYLGYINTRYVRVTPNILMFANGPYIDTYGGTLRLKQNDTNYIHQNGYGDVMIYANGSIRHRFNGNGTKSGGSIEIDGKVLGMTPIDSPQILLEYIEFDIPLIPTGVKVYIEENFRQAVENFTVFPNNGQVIEKGYDYFIIKGEGVADVRIVGKRSGYADHFFENLDNLSESGGMSDAS
jgi:hypothetical protein